MKTYYIFIILILLLVTEICHAHFVECEPEGKTWITESDDQISYVDIGDVAKLDYKWTPQSGTDTTGYIVIDWDNLSDKNPRLSDKAIKDLVTNFIVRKLTNTITNQLLYTVKWQVWFTSECYTNQTCTIKVLLATAFTCCEDSIVDWSNLLGRIYSKDGIEPPQYMDFVKKVNCGKKCCYADFKVTRQLNGTVEYLAIYRQQGQNPGIEVYGCPEPEEIVRHCVKKDPMAPDSLLPIPCIGNCNVR